MQDTLSVARDTLEIALLRAQNDLLAQHYEALEDTVRWAIGGVLALVALVAGVNALLSRSVLGKELETIRKEVDLSIKGAKSELEDESRRIVTQNLIAIEDRLRSDLKTYITKYSHDLMKIRFDSKMDQLKHIYNGGDKSYVLERLSELLSDYKDAYISDIYVSPLLLNISEIINNSESMSITPKATSDVLEAVAPLREGKYAHEVEGIETAIRELRKPRPERGQPASVVSPADSGETDGRRGESSE